MILKQILIKMILKIKFIIIPLLPYSLETKYKIFKFEKKCDPPSRLPTPFKLYIIN